MATMHAVRLHQYGAAENLIYEETQRPEPQPGEALVRVRAIGVNPVDWKTREWRGVAQTLDPPIILGWDIAGVVEEVGSGVDQFAAGDDVFGMVRFPEFGNAYADYVAAPASDLAKKPTNISFAEAAAAPLVTLTAWQALFDVARLQPGQTLLVHAAAGGVGHVAVQLAKWRGARVIGTASAHNADFLRGIGVDHVIDYTHERFEDAVRAVDVVLDTQGDETQRRSFAVLKPGGMLVSIAETPDEALAQTYGVRTARIRVHPSGEQMAQIAQLLDRGNLRVEVARTFPLSEAAEAHRLSETGHTRGKIVLIL
ncbi:MAG TPA: NADP-dependent oxidoreductase [Ktedonobacterales bacterium]|nr:NADP-dependent oxidoreductase [Ktedonobacterales bacterium]